MQTEEGLRRVARESVLDLAADGVVYAEQRYAPEQHLARGSRSQQVVDAVQAGFAEGVAEAATQGRSIRIGTLLTAMRHADRGDEIAALALANRDDGVVGFDIAGAEAGFPPSRQASAFATLATPTSPRPCTPARPPGLESIAEAVHVARACRLGHGVRLIDDVTTDELGDKLGTLAHWVRDRRIPLEMCPSSNVQTGAAESVAAHPVTRLRNLGFAVTVNTDNRLQSGTSMTRGAHAPGRGGRLGPGRPARRDRHRRCALVPAPRRAVRPDRPGHPACVHGGPRRTPPRLSTRTARTPARVRAVVVPRSDPSCARRSSSPRTP